MRWWGAVGREEVPFFRGRGPAEEPREGPSLCVLGVPGPREDWRREEEVGGRGLRRRRLEGSVEGERAEVRAMGLEGREVRGEGCRCEAGCTRRAMGALAMVVEGPALPERGWSGVLVPVVVVERGGRRVDKEVLFRREGS